MAEILTQEEIDELLLAISSGDLDVNTINREEETKRVKIYDFKRPNKFSKDQLRTLLILHENFARLLTSNFSAYLRTMVKIKIISVDQLPYEEYMRSIPNPNMLTVFSLIPLKGNSILEVPPRVAFPFIDRLMGGPGSPLEINRPLSEIEQAIMERVVLKILDNFQEAWKSVVDFTPKIDTVEMNPLFAQIVAANEIVVLITLSVKLFDTEGMISICLPFIVLEPILSKLTVHQWFASTVQDPGTGARDLLQRQVNRAAIPIIARFCETKIKISELLELCVGDVIRTDARVGQTVSLAIGRQEKFHGQAGIVGRKLAVQITSLIEEGDEYRNG